MNDQSPQSPDLNSENYSPNARQHYNQDEHNQQSPPPHHSPTQSPSPQSPASPKSKIPWFKLTLFGFGILALFFSLFKYYFAFYSLDHKYFAGVFYGWRQAYADNAMYAGIWNEVKTTLYDAENEKDAFTRFIKFAEGEKSKTDDPNVNEWTGYHLFDGQPDHFPLTQRYHHELAGNETVQKFYKFRTFMNKLVNTKEPNRNKMQKIENAPFWDKKKMTEEEKEKEKAKEKDAKKKDGPVIQEFTDEMQQDMIETLRKKHKEVYKFVKGITIFFNKYSQNKVKEKVGANTSNEVSNDLKILIESSGIEKELKKGVTVVDVVKKVPESFGTVSANVYMTFFYSRVVYLIYWMTLNADLQVSEQKGVKEAAYRFMTVAKCVDQVFANIYESEIKNYNENKKGLKGLLMGIFGVNVPNYEYDDKNITVIRDELNGIFEETGDDE